MPKTSVLEIDSSPDICDLIRNILGNEGYDVTTAHSLEEVTSLLSHSRFDLIITEALGQTSTFGFDPTFLTGIRSLANNTPIILMSASHQLQMTSNQGPLVWQKFEASRLASKTLWPK